MKRLIEEKIKNWIMDKENIKPLIILGARQVGKTYSVKKVAQELFPNKHIYINFMSKEDRYYDNLNGLTSPEKIIRIIEFVSNQKIDDDTLIIFDEVQEMSSIKTSLKNFVENKIKTKIICMGSYLGNIFNNDNYSFPVGKVNRLYMFPLNFEEFLIAKNKEELLLNAKNDLIENRHINNLTHKFLMDLVREYMIIGGMPEIVQMHLDGAKLIEINQRKKVLLDDYQLDITKTNMSNADKPKATTIFDNIPLFLAKENKKYMLTKIDNSARYLTYQNAIKNLITSKMILKINNVNNLNSPLISKVQENEFKIYYNDCGFVSAIFNITPEIIENEKDDKYANMKGSLAENFVIQEFKSKTNNDWLFYYSFIGNNNKEESNTSINNKRYEIDLVVEDIYGDSIPIEIKYGKRFTEKSLNKVIRDNNPKYSIVFSAKKFSYDEEKRIYKFPIYFVSILDFESDRLKLKTILD